MRRMLPILSAMLVVLSGPAPAHASVQEPAIEAAGVVLAEGVRFAEPERLLLDIYGPREAGPRESRPVIVFFYGGSWNSGSREGYGYIGRALAARGFIVAIPDYRLVPEVRFPVFLEDNAAAVHWVRMHIADYGGDANRIVLAGHSAGAYNAAMLALDRRWLGADHVAVRGLIGLAGPYAFRAADRPATEAAFGFFPDPSATQPINFVTATPPPALIATGQQDNIVEPGKSVALADALRARGGRVELRIYPGIGHIGILSAIADPMRGLAPVLDNMVGFAARVTGELPLIASPSTLYPAR